MQRTYYVRACWDPEAKVWHSESDIPGLVIEADTLAEFEALMHELGPVLLAANADVHQQNVQVDYTVHNRLELAVA